MVHNEVLFFVLFCLLFFLGSVLNQCQLITEYFLCKQRVKMFRVSGGSLLGPKSRLREYKWNQHVFKCLSL